MPLTECSLISVARWTSPESIVVGGTEGKLYIFKNNELCVDIDAHRSTITSIEYNPLVETIYTSDQNGTIKGWSIDGTLKFSSYDGIPLPMWKMRLSPKKNYILGVKEKSVSLWWNTGEFIDLQNFSATVIDAVWINEKNILVSFENGEIHILDSTLHPDHMLEAIDSFPLVISVSPRGKYLLAIWENGDIMTWKNEREKTVLNNAYESAEKVSIGCIFDDGQVLIGTRKGKVISIKGRKSGHTLFDHKMMTTTIAVSTNGIIASGASSGKIAINNVEIGQLPDAVLEIHWNPDDTTIAAITLSRDTYIIKNSKIMKLSRKK